MFVFLFVVFPFCPDPDPRQLEDMTVTPPPDNPTLKRHWRRVPNAESHRLYNSWITLPTLANSLMAFMSRWVACHLQVASLLIVWMEHMK